MSERKLRAALESVLGSCVPSANTLNEDGKQILRNARALLDATPPVAESAGQDMVLVPREPTKEMLDAVTHGGGAAQREHCKLIYSGMLNAALQPAPEQQVKRYSLTSEGGWGAMEIRPNGTYVLYSDYKRDLSAATQRAEAFQLASERCSERCGEQILRAEAAEASLKEREAAYQELNMAAQTTVTVPLEPSDKLLASMATRMRHDFGLLDEAIQRVILSDMRKVHEEVVGTGFYRAAPSPAVAEAPDQGDDAPKRIEDVYQIAKKLIFEFNGRICPQEILTGIQEIANIACAPYPTQAEAKDAFEQGWRVAAEWAKRDDLLADIGSPAYERDRLAAMAADKET